ncbi:12455_t:CDS:2 [Ambispora gerdemannii]|uniref:12455_t:CDS:1 n=1 Tax=Ambispora gerdemannii TaxID=144530 RepID=A0A9N9AWV2_9GLOM|nr:12455_t:CDS:2 [Ambispora gerdemannii]
MNAATASRFTGRKTVLWLTIPLIAATTYSLSRARFGQVSAQKKYETQDFTRDPVEIQNLRQEWLKQNNGLGLRDVSRSCGGV